MQATTQATTSAVSMALDDLLRGEISAVETYSQAIEKLGAGFDAAELVRIRGEHQAAVKTWSDHIASRGGDPPTTSGLWGAWAVFVEGAAGLTGSANALRALKAGEEHGIGLYERTLKNGGLDAECETLIHDKLLPQTRAHLPALDRLISAQ